MNIIILGAGELGKQLAWTLCDKKNRVVVVDLSGESLERLGERLDVLTVTGYCADSRILKQAGVESTDLMLAVTGDNAANVLACQAARHFGVRKTVCRLSSANFFSEEDGFSPSAVGIDDTVFPEEECVSRIVNVLRHRDVVERITFSVPGVEMSGFRIRPGTPLVGMRIADFPDTELLRNVRFSAIIRNRKLHMPTGETVFQPGDEAYVAGSTEHVDRVLSMATPEKTKPIGFVLVAGASSVGRKLVAELVRNGLKVRAVERDQRVAEDMLDGLGEDVMVIRGDYTDTEVLEDAGAGYCDAFVSASRDDEDSILSCVLAKALGAGKVINISNKAQYVDIVPAMTSIDCGFSPRLVAVNSILRVLGNDAVRVHAILHRAHAYVYEFEVQKRARVCGQPIAACDLPPSAIFALVFREGTALPAVGDVVLQEKDMVAVVTVSQEVAVLEKLFRKRGRLHL